MAEPLEPVNCCDAPDLVCIGDYQTWAVYECQNCGAFH